MSTIVELQQRAAALKAKYQKETITPEEVGQLHEDTLAYIADLERYVDNLGVRKTYASKAEMDADVAPVGTNGKAMRYGQLAVIRSSDGENGNIYAYQKPGWLLVGNLNEGQVVNDLVTGGSNVPLSAEQGKVLDKKISENASAIPAIADDLVTDDSTKALSAKQGKLLDVKATINASALTVEVNRAKAAEQLNANAVSEETTRAQGVENALKTRVEFTDISYHEDLEYSNKEWDTIVGSFQKGRKIFLRTSDYTSTPSSVKTNVAVIGTKEDGTNEIVAVLYSNGQLRKVLESNYVKMYIREGYEEGVESFTVSVDFAYGLVTDIDEKVDYSDVVNDLVTGGSNVPLSAEQGKVLNAQNSSEHAWMNKKLSLLGFPESESMFRMSGVLTDWIYSSTSAYIGYNKGFDTDVCLTKFRITLYKASQADIGLAYTFVVGTIDQRGWLLPRETFEERVSSVAQGTLTFDFKKAHIAMAGESLFILVSKSVSADANVLIGLSTADYNAQCPLVWTKNLSTAVTVLTEKGAQLFEITYLTCDFIFAMKSTYEAIQSDIVQLYKDFSNSRTIMDSVTGNPYRITVSDGNIVLQSMTVKNLLVIGHSFVVYPNAPTADWYLDDGENRAMSPTITSHQWTEFIKMQLKLTSCDLKSGVSFERDFEHYDLTNLNIQDNYDAICVYLGENALYNDKMQSAWERLCVYLKAAAPKARIFVTGSWEENSKKTAIRNACNNVSDIVYVDLTGTRVTTANHSVIWKKGDYYLGRNSEYYAIGKTSSHPNDLGHLIIANTFIKYMGGLEITNKTHLINLVQTDGGTIETPNVIWVEDGIVTIRTIPMTGKSISDVSVIGADGVAITATLRTNTALDGVERLYYTFTMPAQDVTVIPTWG